MARTIFILLIGLFAGFVSGVWVGKGRQPAPERYIDYAQLRGSLDRDTTRNFTPVVGRNRHIVIRYKISQGQVLPAVDTADVKLAYGKLPKMPSSGTFRVRYYSSKAAKIFTYYLTNPFYIRVEGGGAEARKRISEGLFYVRLPKDQTIEWVAFEEVGERQVVSDIRGKLSHIP